MDNENPTLSRMAAATAEFSPPRALFSMIGLLVDRLSHDSPPCTIAELFEASGDRGGVKFCERLTAEPLTLSTLIRALAVTQAETPASRFQLERLLIEHFHSAALTNEPWFLDRVNSGARAPASLETSLIHPADAIAWLRNNPLARSLLPPMLQAPNEGSDANTEETRPLVQPLTPDFLRRHLETIKADHAVAPAADSLYHQLKTQFSTFRVSRQSVRQACIAVWGEQPPGRRTKRC